MVRAVRITLRQGRFCFFRPKACGYFDSLSTEVTYYRNDPKRYDHILKN